MRLSLPEYRPTCLMAVLVAVTAAISACSGQGQTGRVEDTSEVSDTSADTSDTSTTEPDIEDTSTTDTAGPDTTLDTADSTNPDGDAIDTHDSRPDEDTSLPDVPDTAEPDWTTSENYPRVIPTGDPCEGQADCPSHLVCDLQRASGRLI